MYGPPATIAGWAPGDTDTKRKKPADIALQRLEGTVTRPEAPPGYQSNKRQSPPLVRDKDPEGLFAPNTGAEAGCVSTRSSV
jgi:hypothetical protein